MEHDIKINEEEVVRKKEVVQGIVAEGITATGDLICNVATGAIRESQGVGLQTGKVYLNQEQITMKEAGAGFEHLINHLQEATKEMKI